MRKAADIQEIKPQRISLEDPQTAIRKLPRVPKTIRPYILSFNHYLRPIYPCGSIFKFQFHSTCNSRDMIGVETIRLVGINGKVIPFDEVLIGHLFYCRFMFGRTAVILWRSTHRYERLNIQVHLRIHHYVFT